MDIRDNKKFCSIHFGSILDLLDQNYSGISASTYKHYMSSHNSGGPSWLGMGNKNGKDVINHVLLGHKEMHEELMYRAKWLSEQKRDTYDQLVVKRKRKRMRGDFGDELDIHQVNLGNFDKAYSYRKHIETDKKTNLVTIMIDVGGLGQADVENSLWRGAVAIKLVDQLIGAGKSVRVIVGSSAAGVYRGEHREHTTTITVKEYNEPLSMERLSAMCHLGFHRTFNFAARACFNKNGLSSTMGRTTSSLRDHPPATMEEEIKNGSTKYIYLSRAMDRMEGISSLERAYGQMKEYSKAA